MGDTEGMLFVREYVQECGLAFSRMKIVVISRILNIMYRSGRIADLWKHCPAINRQRKIMRGRQKSAIILAILLVSLIPCIPAWAHGDRVLPHVVNGSQGDGIGFRTKFDFTNLSPTFPITKVTISFYRTLAGSAPQPWTVATNQGTKNSFTLNMGTYQTMRLETQGTGDVAHGYAVISSQEDSSIYADDYEIGISVYFEVLNAGHVVDTVSVPAGLPTASFSFPFEIVPSNGLNTGLALVNLTNGINRVVLRLYQATDSSATNIASPVETITVALDGGANKKVVQFLDQAPFKSMSQLGVSQFKGMAVCSSDGPVSVLTMLQTQTQDGIQYATLVPSYTDSLRRNSFLYFPQSYALDADLAIVDYWQTEFESADSDLEKPWDVLFQSQDRTNLKQRYLTPQQGAILARIGIKTDGEFDLMNLADIQSAIAGNPVNRIDLSDGSSDLAPGFVFAIKTALGRYAKVMIWTYVAYSDSGYKDLLAKIYIYK
jgi:hypothetical protein